MPKPKKRPKFQLLLPTLSAFLLAAAFPGCAKAPSTEATAQSTLVSNQPPTEIQLKAFQNSVYKITHSSCIACHGTGSQVPHASDDLKAAYASARQRVSFENIGSSKLIERAMNGHCGSDLCRTDGIAMTRAVTLWRDLERSQSEVADCERRITTPVRLWRLSRSEYDATLTALFGDVSNYGKNLPPDEKIRGFDNNATALGVGNVFAEQLMYNAETIALRYAPGLTASSGAYACPSSATAEQEAACVTHFIEVFGKKIYRRPILPAETTKLKQVYTAGRMSATYADGIQLVLQAMLQSPHFLFRPELGEASLSGATSKTTRLTPYETASALSYLIIGGPPDAALMAAADQNKLSTPIELEAQAQRLLGTQDATKQFNRFASSWLGLDKLDSAEKNPSFFNGFNATLKSKLRQETEMFVADTAFGPEGSLDQLFNADYTYVDGTLASLYGFGGSPAPDSFQKVSSPSHRKGILSQGSLLAAYAHSAESSPVLRGKFVRERLLCQDLPPPPPEIMVTPPLPSATLTTRQRYAAHVNNQQCASCHHLMDPLGFGFEHFDAIGRYRATENQSEIDASGEVSGTNASNGTFDGLPGLARNLASSQDAQECYLLNYFRFASGKAGDDDDSCYLANAGARFSSDGKKTQKNILQYIQSDEFVLRAKEPQ